jgi:hypothetical protein
VVAGDAAAAFNDNLSEGESKSAFVVSVEKEEEYLRALHTLPRYATNSGGLGNPFAGNI